MAAQPSRCRQQILGRIQASTNRRGMRETRVTWHFLRPSRSYAQRLWGKWWLWTVAVLKHKKTRPIQTARQLSDANIQNCTQPWRAHDNESRTYRYLPSMFSTLSTRKGLKSSSSIGKEGRTAKKRGQTPLKRASTTSLGRDASNTPHNACNQDRLRDIPPDGSSNRPHNSRPRICTIGPNSPRADPLTMLPASPTLQMSTHSRHERRACKTPFVCSYGAMPT